MYLSPIPIVVPENAPVDSGLGSGQAPLQSYLRNLFWLYTTFYCFLNIIYCQWISIYVDKSREANVRTLFGVGLPISSLETEEELWKEIFDCLPVLDGFVVS